MNLVINGAEAIPAGTPGVLTVTTESRRPTLAEIQRTVIPLANPSEDYVVLSVRDTGSGMDAATVARIFDRFFTTKFAGRGLGLSSVLGIVKAHSGTMIIESAPGQGTTFRVFLKTTAKTPQPVVVQEVETIPGTGAILVVDDEDAVRTLAMQALELSGYNAISARDGAEALAAVLEHPEIDAIVLDLAMPNMPGDIAAPEIRKLRPDVDPALDWLRRA